ncbi:MAG: phosphatidate cytidylyltransferase [Clostridia bacterium]|nr:phosphatidate cytidylyltransferase [Clostridia bacterium]
MKKRLPTSIFILIFTIGFVLLRQFSLLFFDAFALTMMLGSVIEVVRVQKKQNQKIDAYLLYAIPLALFAIFAFAKGKLVLILCLILLLVSALYLLTFEIFAYAKTRKANENVPAEEINAHLFDRTKNTMMVFGYPILPLSFMFVINHLGYQVGYMGIVLIFATAMMTDTFAYLIGCAFGKRRFIPEVSPKKSIAGVFGGFLGGILGVALVFVFFYFTKWFNILNEMSLLKSISAFAVIGVIGSYANQLGDLVASAYKRKAGIKDFSNIFPGHGGFMDRVDGMMFVSVVIFIVLSLFFV